MGVYHVLVLREPRVEARDFLGVFDDLVFANLAPRAARVNETGVLVLTECFEAAGIRKKEARPLAINMFMLLEGAFPVAPRGCAGR
jgi:hypothetical protein